LSRFFVDKEYYLCIVFETHNWEEEMVANVLNWITKNGGWKIILVVVGLLLVFIALITSIAWYLLGALVCVTPKMIEKLEDKSLKMRKEEDQIEQKTTKQVEEIVRQANKEEQAVEEQTRKEEKERLDKWPKEKTAKELTEEILRELDKDES
jgi:proteasome assembly chaperone (PAC2) family protein